MASKMCLWKNHLVQASQPFDSWESTVSESLKLTKQQLPRPDKPLMDRRLEPRIRAYEAVNLTVLGDQGYSTQANAIQLSVHGMRLVTDRPIAVNAAIKVVCDDWLALGEVCYCMQERGHYVVGLQLDQALVGLKELDARNRDLSTQELSPAPYEVEQLLS